METHFNTEAKSISAGLLLSIIIIIVTSNTIHQVSISLLMNGPIHRVRTGHGKPGKSWNSSEGHGKLWKSKKILRQKYKKFEEITDELETRFTLSRNKDKHVLYAL